MPELSPIPFVKAYLAGDELAYVNQSFSSAAVAGDGPFTARATELITKFTGGAASLLTTSCTTRWRWPRCCSTSRPATR